MLDEFEANRPEQFDPASFVADTAIHISGTISDVSKDESGNVVIVDASGTRTTVPAGTSAAITDSSGNGYLVDKKGNIHKTSADVAAKAGNREYNLALKFDASPNQAFGFDVKHDPLAVKYERLEGDKYASWKSVATGRTDAVLAILEGTGFDKSKIRFEQAGLGIGHQASATTSMPNAATIPMPNAFELNVRGTADGIEEGLLALYTPPDTTQKEQVLGKLNVATYDEIQKTVIIVPVNGNKYPYSEANLRTQLNKIYGQAVVKWNVQMAPEGFVVPGIDPFDDGGSGLLSNYSPDMRKVVDAYSTDPAPDTYYLFLVKNPKAGKLAGYMPRSKEFGFIFTDQAGSEQAIIHTIAHELGHGAFNLRHTFAEEKYTIPQGSTDNLMDYTQAFGTKLFKHQWDLIRFPEMLIGVFEKDEDAASVTVNNIELLAGWEYNNIGFAFLAPSGKVLLLPKNVKSIKFSTGDPANSKDADIVKIVPFGTVIEFNIDGMIFKGMWHEDSNSFTGYKVNDLIKYHTLDFFRPEDLSEPLNKVIVGVPVFESESFSYHTYHIPYERADINEIKQPNYNSSGDWEAYDFLNNKILSGGQSKKIPVPPSFNSNQDVNNFVLYYLNLDEQNRQIPTYSVYLYTHASLLDRYGLLGKCFASGLPGKFLENIKPFVKWNNYVRASVPTPISFPSGFELAENGNKIAFNYLLSNLSGANVNYYKELTKIIAQLRALQISDDVKEANTVIILDSFSEYLNLDTDNFDCLFSELSLDNKKKIIKHLLSNQQDDWGNKYEKLTIKILESLKENEILPVFADFRSRPEYMFNAFGKLDNLLSGKYLHLFVYHLLYGWNNTADAVKLKYPEYDKDLSMLSETGYNEFFKKVIQDERVIILEDIKLFSGTESDLELFTNWDNDFLLDLSQKEVYLNGYGRALVNFFDQYNFGFSNLLIGQKRKGVDNLNPLDPVIVFISPKDSADLSLSIRPGVYALPAIFIHFVRTQQQANIDSFYWRMAFNALAIALAPFTGGSTLLITLEIALPVVDIVLSATQEELSGFDSPGYMEFMGYWNGIYQTYGIALGGIGLFKAAPAITQGGRQVIRLVANPRLASRIAKQQIKNFDAVQFADKIEELANALGASWINYAKELRALSASVRLNANLSLASLYSQLDGYVNAESRAFLLGKESYVQVFKCELRSGVVHLDELRLLRNFNNVKRTRYAGEMTNVRFIEDGREISNLYVVEDLDNVSSYFIVTEKDLTSGLGKVENFSDVVKEIRIVQGVNPLIASLSGSIKTTYETLIASGLTAKVPVSSSSILLKNAADETVAIITAGKLRPVKWAWEARFPNTQKAIISEGYIVVKTVDDVKVDLGFKEGRNLEATEVNDYLVNGQGKDLDGQPYWSGTQVDELMLSPGTEIHFVENANSGGPAPGQYGSREATYTIEDLRQKLAVKEAWKSIENQPTLRTYRTKKPLRVRSGTIGKQRENGVDLPGGGHQYEVIDYLGPNWREFLDEISVPGGVRLTVSGRHPDWIEITGITSKIEAKIPHVDYLDFKGNGFEGCHTQNAMNQYLANNPGWTGGFVDGSGNAINLMDNIPIEAYPWVKDLNGNLFTKTNGAQKTINGVQYGKASFFPKNWNTAKLKAEVEHAIANNHGLVTGNTYKGFSSDGTVEIWFYYNTSNGSIISFFPKVN
jgi:hypothetical protein